MKPGTRCTIFWLVLSFLVTLLGTAKADVTYNYVGPQFDLANCSGGYHVTCISGYITASITIKGISSTYTGEEQIDTTNISSLNVNGSQYLPVNPPICPGSGGQMVFQNGVVTHASLAITAITNTNCSGGDESEIAITKGDFVNIKKYLPGQANYYSEIGDADYLYGTWTIATPPPPPVASNEVASTYPDTPVTIDLSVGASGLPTSAALVGKPTGGTVTGFPSTTVTFTPKTGFVGDASFQFTLSNSGGSSEVATATITVKLVYYYNTAYESIDARRMQGRFSIEMPKVALGAGHSLAEIAALTTDHQQIIEVGWNVDPTMYHDNSPHLFVFHWVNGMPTCYPDDTNPCDFKLVSQTMKPGMVLSTESPPIRFDILHSGDRWFIYVSGEKLGTFSDNLWAGQFTKISEMQWFGEVASTSITPKTWMGNGYLGSKFKAAHIDSMAFVDISGSTDRAQPAFIVPTPDYYLAGPYNTIKSGFHYGGKGARSQ